MFTSTQLKLRADNPITNEKVIEEQISTDLSSEFKLNAYDGCMYYKRKNTLINTLYLERKDRYDKSKNKNRCISNHKNASGFLKKLIDQKVNYLLGKPVVVNNADNCNEIFDINSIIKKAGKEASKKGVEWLHPYINKDGEFKVVNIDGQECIPIWDTEYENELQQMIRYYKIHVVVDGEEKTRYKVELWDKEKVEYYMQDEDGGYYFDTTLENNPVWHYSSSINLGEKTLTKEYFGWGKVPFVPVWNNDDKINDLEAIKPDIDMYDIVKSDFCNDLDRFAQSIMMIKNHSAESSEKFLQLLQDEGIIEVDEDGDVKWLTHDIPFEARDNILNRLKDDIYEFGQGVDIKSIGRDTTNITNVAIKVKYAELDLKADDFEAEVTFSIKDLYWFINRFLLINNKSTDDLSKIEVKYNRNIIFNEGELIDNFLKSNGRPVSFKTALGIHPRVDDVDEEMKQIKKEEKEMPDDNTGNPFNPGQQQQKKEDEE